MKKYSEIQDDINSLQYWDAAVKTLECNFFADEVILSFEGIEKDNTLIFDGCYRVNFDHVKSYDKLRPVKDMSHAQIPYFMQNVTLSTVEVEEIEFYACKIEMFPLTLEILCKSISINS